MKAGVVRHWSTDFCVVSSVTSFMLFFSFPSSEQALTQLGRGPHVEPLLTDNTGYSPSYLYTPTPTHIDTNKHSSFAHMNNSLEI